MPIGMRYFRQAALWSAVPVRRVMVKARKPPTKLGSNQVERRRPVCGSQPRSSS